MWTLCREEWLDTIATKRDYVIATILCAMKKGLAAIIPLMSVDRGSSKPLHRQIYESYRSAIVSHQLRPGQRVPSSRGLAAELRISRIPVLNSHAQLLAEGYFESRKGAGTFISRSLPEQMTVCPPRTARAASLSAAPRRVSSTVNHLPPAMSKPWVCGRGAFSVSQLGFDHFPLQVWSNLMTRHCRNLQVNALHYVNPMGSEALREAIATYLRTARAVRCEARQIMIVNGSQQALEISARALLDPGDQVWIEDPGYRMARYVFMMARCRLVPVPVDEEGLMVGSGIKRARNARAAFVTPSHQFPLGVTMSASRRLQLLHWAQRSGSWIIEDDYDSEYRYASRPVASLQGLDTDCRVIYIGTFSKVLFPSMRLGYMVIPSDLVGRFAAVRHAIDLGAPEAYQAALIDFIAEGHFARHLRRMRLLYGSRRNALVESLRQELGSMLEVVGGEAGMHLAALLPKGFRDEAIAEKAALQKLWLWPLSPSYLGESPRHGFILGFGGISEKEMAPAVRKLRGVLKDR
jgi:GntR family transcriptional regulator/MocR family aminotransferase